MSSTQSYASRFSTFLHSLTVDRVVSLCVWTANLGLLSLVFLWAALEVVALIEPEQYAALYGIDETRRLPFVQVSFLFYACGLLSLGCMGVVGFFRRQVRPSMAKAQVVFSVFFLAMNSSSEARNACGMIYNTDKNWLYDHGIMLGVIPGGTPIVFVLLLLSGLVVLRFCRTSTTPKRMEGVQKPLL